MKTATLSKAALLNEAVNCIYDFGCGDASDTIAKLNLRYGLGKIIWALKRRKLNTGATFAVTTPDSGITRNKERWHAGFSYGCLIRWPSKEETGSSIVFPQIKPNACGMLVAKILNCPRISSLCQKLSDIEKKGLEVDASKLKLNVGASNHFIEVCQVEESQNSLLTPGDNVVVIHTSPSEHKSLLYDFKSWIERGGSWEPTPLGHLLSLDGKIAEDYLNTYKNIEEFSYKKRLVLAKHLFGDFEVISNLTHQGIFGDNEARLGLYRFEDEEQVFPVTFRWDLNVYLMRPKPNIDESILDSRFLTDQRVKELLTNLNMLPHGGGYKIPFAADNWQVIESDSRRLFAYKNGQSDFAMSSPSEIPYSYRGLQILDKISKLKLGSVAAKLKQLYTLKY